MRILLTNDDGLRAPGIVALYDALMGHSEWFDAPIGGRETEVVPIAPLTVQSATSHGVTFHEPLMVREEAVTRRMRGVAVDGRPADCVKLAVSALWPERFGEGERPDLLISGMNAGANCGINVIYSGTVAAALEGAFLGVPSIAVSLHLGTGTPLFDVAAAHARRAIESLIAGGLPAPHECLNINVPRTEVAGSEARGVAEERIREYESSRGPASAPLPAGLDATRMPPISVCPMNRHGLVDEFERRESPGGDVYYWSSGYGLNFTGTDEGSDVQLMLDRHITVTALTYDLTDHARQGAWRERLG
jgi:5'-nucleotidase